MSATDAKRDQAFQAVRDGDKDTLVALIKEDHKIRDIRNTDGISLLLFAIYNQKKDMADLLVKFAAKFDVFSAAAYGAFNEITLLLKANRSLVNTYSPDGWTPLHLASFFGNIMVAEFLIVADADVNAVSTNALKNQPLNAATVSNKTDVAELLLKNGANVNFAQHEGITPLHAAAYNGNEELVRILLAHGADKAIKNDKGETAFDMAAMKEHARIASLLRSP